MISGLMRTRNSRRAFAEFDALRASGLPLSDNPTSAHLSTIMLFGAAWNGHLDRFAELLQVVKDTALPMDGYLGNALIYAHGAAGDLDKAKEVFDRMVDKMDRENGVSDVASDGPGDSAEEAMMLHGIARGEPVHTYNSMMAAYLHCRQPAGAYELLKMMREREVAPSGMPLCVTCAMCGANTLSYQRHRPSPHP